MVSSTVTERCALIQHSWRAEHMCREVRSYTQVLRMFANSLLQHYFLRTVGCTIDISRYMICLLQQYSKNDWVYDRYFMIHHIYNDIQYLHIVFLLAVSQTTNKLITGGRHFEAEMFCVFTADHLSKIDVVVDTRAARCKMGVPTAGGPER